MTIVPTYTWRNSGFKIFSFIDLRAKAVVEPANHNPLLPWSKMPNAQLFVLSLIIFYSLSMIGRACRALTNGILFCPGRKRQCATGAALGVPVPAVYFKILLLVSYWSSLVSTPANRNPFPVSGQRRRDCRTRSWFYYCTVFYSLSMIGRDLVTPANRNLLLSQVEEDGAAERAVDTTILYFIPYLWLVET